MTISSTSCRRLRKPCCSITPQYGGCPGGFATSANIAATMWRWRWAEILSAMLPHSQSWRPGGTARRYLAPAATGGSLLHRARRILDAEVHHTANDWSVPIVLIAAALATATVLAQSQDPEPSEKFEVASVRPNTADDVRSTVDVQPGGRFTAFNVRLRNLIINAYRLQGSQLVGAPGWISSERFDIVAKGEGDIRGPVSPDGPGRVQLMIRSLLADRFHLKVHRETRDVPIYDLVRARVMAASGQT